MKRFYKNWIPILMIIVIGIIFYEFGIKNQASEKLHLIKVKNPNQLKELLHYNGDVLPIVSGHRGGSLPDFPENCIATFENTLKYTYATIECDPRFTKDSVIVLHHDPNLRRTTNGQGNINSYTLAEIKNFKLKGRDGKITDFQIPTLDEALEWAKGKSILVLDSKEVPITTRVKKAVEHKAEANVIMIVYSFEEAKECYNFNRNIMMEVMIPSIDKGLEFEKTEVPWSNVIAFVGHNIPQDKALFDWLHQRGVMCMAGSSRNVDLKYLTGKVKDFSELKTEYAAFQSIGIDLIETDLPRELGTLLFKNPIVGSSKLKYLKY